MRRYWRSRGRPGPTVAANTHWGLVRRAFVACLPPHTSLPQLICIPRPHLPCIPRPHLPCTVRNALHVCCTCKPFECTNARSQRASDILRLRRRPIAFHRARTLLGRVFNDGRLLGCRLQQRVNLFAHSFILCLQFVRSQQQSQRFLTIFTPSRGQQPSLCINQIKLLMIYAKLKFQTILELKSAQIE